LFTGLRLLAPNDENLGTSLVCPLKALRIGLFDCAGADMHRTVPQKYVAPSLHSVTRVQKKGRCAFSAPNGRARSLHCSAGAWSSDSGEDSGKEYDSWRKKVFGMKPKEPGSTKNPSKSDPIDTEWQVLYWHPMSSMIVSSEQGFIQIVSSTENHYPPLFGVDGAFLNCPSIRALHFWCRRL